MSKNGWLEAIIGVKLTEDQDTAIAKHIGTNFVTKDDFNAKNLAYENAIKEVQTRDGQIEELKKVDAVGLQQTILDLQKANMEAQQRFDQELVDFKRDAALESALLKRGAQSVKAAKALIDMETIKQTKTGDFTGIEEAVEKAVTEVPRLFNAVDTANNTTHIAHETNYTPTHNDAVGADSVSQIMNSMIRGGVS